jgi:transcriptional regulator GlxA family with amidase domain
LKEVDRIMARSVAIRQFETVARLRNLLDANHNWPLNIVEICAKTGVSERTLCVYCRRYLATSPARYLRQQRMQLAREALVRADRTNVTVSKITADFGFTEFGRFSVNYRTLFGESPSATLHRPSQSGRPAGMCG